MLIWWAGCGGSGQGRAALDGGDDAIAALRYRVATAPQDGAARVALARLEHEAGRPGAALAHLSLAARNSRLARADRALLATLHARRFEERLAVGDGAAYQDAEAALRLDGAVALAPALRAEGYFLAALAALRRGNVWGRRDAAGFLARAAALAPGDARAAAMLATAPATSAGSEGRAWDDAAGAGSEGRAWDDAAGAGSEGRARDDAAGAGSEGLARDDARDSRLDDLAQAALWLHRGGARHAALDLLERYLREGGRDREVLQALVVERAWWRGADARPGLLPARALRAVGVSLCPLARTPEDLGCDASLWAVAEAGGALATGIWGRAERLSWRTDVPHQAAAWALLGLRAWLDGHGSWTALVRRRVEVARVLGDPDRLAALPAHVAPVLWRAAGNPARAAAALDRVLAQVLGPDALPGPGAAGPPRALSAGVQALVVAEAAAQGRPAQVVDALRARLPGAGALGWQAAVRHARALGDAHRLAALLAEQPELARAYLRRSGDLGPLAWAFVPGDDHTLAWWWHVLDRHPRLAAGRDALWESWRQRGAPPSGWRLPAGVPVDLPAAVLALVPASGSPTAHAPVPAALVAVARAYQRDPAVADRLARELVQGAASASVHGPAVAALFAGLGDPARALAWWEHLAAESPEHPPYLLALGVAAAAAGDATRARVHFNAAAARAGDAGATSLHAAGHLLRQGLALEALGEGQRALALTAPGERGPVLALLATAMASLGREQDARAMGEAWRAELPPAARAHAPGPPDMGPDTADIEMDMGAGMDAHMEVAVREPSVAMIQAARDPDPDRAWRRLATSLAWHPGHVGLHRALLAGLEPGSDAHARAVAALLGVALSAPPERARSAFQVLAGELARMGARDEAHLARMAYRALASALGPLVPAHPPAL